MEAKKQAAESQKREASAAAAAAKAAQAAQAAQQEQVAASEAAEKQKAADELAEAARIELAWEQKQAELRAEEERTKANAAAEIAAEEQRILAEEEAAKAKVHTSLTHTRVHTEDSTAQHIQPCGLSIVICALSPVADNAVRLVTSPDGSRRAWRRRHGRRLRAYPRRLSVWCVRCARPSL